MERFRQYLTDDEYNALLEQGEDFIKKFEAAQTADTYKASNFQWQRTQLMQILKGVHKYPEPLNHESWTFTELVDHAYQENVDQAHYLSALQLKANQYEQKIQDLTDKANYWRNKYRAQKYITDELQSRL